MSVQSSTDYSETVDVQAEASKTARRRVVDDDSLITPVQACRRFALEVY